MKKLFERLREPSSYAGISAILLGAGTLFKDDNLPVIADAIQNGGDVFTATQNPMTALGVLVTGLLALFMPERKK